MILKQFTAWTRWLADTGKRFVTWFIAAVMPMVLEQNPTALSVSGGVLMVAAGAAFALSHQHLAGILVICGGFFDIADGAAARHQRRTSDVGAFADSFIDRVGDLAIFLGIIIAFAFAGDVSAVILGAGALMMGMLTSYARARAECFAQVVSLSGGILERGWRLIILIIGSLTGFLVPALWIVFVLGFITVCQRCALAYKKLQRVPVAAAVRGRAIKAEIL